MTAIGFMLAALAIQGSQPQSMAPSANNNDGIIVLAHRLSKIRWEYEAKNGILSKCEIKRTSGSHLVDTLVCQASAQCAAEQPQLGDSELLPCIRDRVSRLNATR